VGGYPVGAKFAVDSNRHHSDGRTLKTTAGHSKGAVGGERSHCLVACGREIAALRATSDIKSPASRVALLVGYVIFGLLPCNPTFAGVGLWLTSGVRESYRDDRLQPCGLLPEWVELVEISVLGWVLSNK
jgi:hypothetical protein